MSMNVYDCSLSMTVEAATPSEVPVTPPLAPPVPAPQCTKLDMLDN